VREATVSAELSGLVVTPSPIHGLGVFAKRSFLAGQLLFSTDEYSVTPYPIYGSVRRGPTEHLLEPQVLRWTNHSCEPNARVRFRGRVAEILASRPVRAGDEVVCDYLETEDEVPFPFRCNCGHCDGVWIG